MADSRLCSFQDCGKPHFAKSFCSRHYRRLHIYGDPGFTKIRADHEIENFYRSVVLQYEGDECLIWPFSMTEGGYALWKPDKTSTAIVSRRLCSEVHGPAPSKAHHAAHSCGKGKQGCVAKSHISWKTKSENEQEKLEHGTDNRGERHGMSKLKTDDVIAIYALRGSEQKKTIAKMFGVSPSIVSMIHLGKRWAWLTT